MQKLLTRIVKAPLTYIADLRAITFKQYLLIHTNFSPSYPVMIFTSLIFTLLLAGTLLGFVFTDPMNSKCFDNIKGVSYVIAFLYPIQSIMCFICLTGTIALSKSRCWKVSWILLFGPILSGFGFGEVGLLEICALSSGQNQLIRSPAIIKRQSFIDAIIYLYISFFAMYFILVPSINYIYNRQQLDLQKKPAQKTKNSQGAQQVVDQPKKTCCSRFVVVLYYFLNTLLVICVAFLLFIKIAGPVIFTYLWIQLAANSSYMTTSIQKMLLAFSILAYFAPISLMIITIGIQRIFKLGKGKKDNAPAPKQQDLSDKKTIDLQFSQKGRASTSQRPSNVSKVSKKQISGGKQQLQIDQQANTSRISSLKSNIKKQPLL